MTDARTCSPVVGITSIPRPVQTLAGEYPGQTMTDSFPEGIVRAGGTPLLVPSLESDQAPAVVARLDALILSGGSDVDPGCYGGVMHPSMTWVDPGRDRWELALLAQALACDLPTLGVCRGMQVINVHHGGTLKPDLPDELGHARGWEDREARHGIHVDERSWLADFLGPGDSPAAVTTFHHQAVDRVGGGLEVRGNAADGTIEIIEDPNAPLVGVAWHPELQLDEQAGQPVFNWLVQVATERVGTRA